ncbi:MAG: MptD family putative ECF transporter S component [Deltaproteobacteria bacterium]|jgi:hypothetical protein|nr:MptD family putative ECF transporter S component [Deltaproteobacteria bacterium]
MEDALQGGGTAPPPGENAAWRFTLGDLATIGVLSALARATGLMLVFALGGMNPVSLSLRTLAITVLIIVLRMKVRRFGTLVLATLVGALTSFFAMGQGVMSLPAMLAAALLADLFITYVGRNRAWAVIVGCVLMSLMDKAASLCLMLLATREEARMMWPFAILIVTSAAGDLLALVLAPRFIRELRHAGFINC